VIRIVSRGSVSPITVWHPCLRSLPHCYLLQCHASGFGLSASISDARAGVAPLQAFRSPAASPALQTFVGTHHTGWRRLRLLFWGRGASCSYAM